LQILFKGILTTLRSNRNLAAFLISIVLMEIVHGIEAMALYPLYLSGVIVLLLTISLAFLLPIVSLYGLHVLRVDALTMSAVLAMDRTPQEIRGLLLGSWTRWPPYREQGWP